MRESWYYFIILTIAYDWWYDDLYQSITNVFFWQNEYIFALSNIGQMNVQIYLTFLYWAEWIFKYIQDNWNMSNEYLNIFKKFPLRENYDINSGHYILPAMTKSTVHTSLWSKIIWIIWNWWRHDTCQFNLFKFNSYNNHLLNIYFLTEWISEYIWCSLKPLNECPNIFDISL